MNDVYIVAACRTPIGVRGGAFSHTPPERLAAQLFTHLYTTCGQPAIDAVIGGNAVGPGGNLTRLAALYADWPETIPAWTVDQQCASAAAALGEGAVRIAAGAADVVIAGGMESASLQPIRRYASGDARQGEFTVAQFSPEENHPDAMLRGAERAARALDVSREMLDEYALDSHHKALTAAERGLLTPYIVPTDELAGDECLRPRISRRLLARMPLLLGPDTRITAGNSCLIHDGAAFALLASSAAVRAYGWTPQARIRTVAAAAGAPLLSPLSVGAVTDELLRRSGLAPEDIDCFEWNEAFAVIDALFAARWPALLDRYNRVGGALAYGHPYGASGAILLVHLLAALQDCSGRIGLLAIAGAGGTGAGLIVEACHD